MMILVAYSKEQPACKNPFLKLQIQEDFKLAHKKQLYLERLPLTLHYFLKRLRNFQKNFWSIISCFKSEYLPFLDRSRFPQEKSLGERNFFRFLARIIIK